MPFLPRHAAVTFTLLATAAASLPLALPIAQPAGASTTATIAVRPAPQRAMLAPARAYLSGLTLHLGRGKGTVRVQLPAANAKNLTLLGKTPRGYAVVDDSVQPVRFYTVETTGTRIGFARRFWQQRTPRGLDLYLSNDGTRVLMENDGSKSGQEFTVFTIEGKGVDRILLQGNGAGILDFTGSRAILAVSGAILDWKIGSTPTRLDGLEGSGADIGKSLLFRRTAAGLDGPVALGAPRGPLRWAVSGFDPFAVSPQGNLVVGFAGRAPTAATVVRNRSDGKLRSSVPLGDYDKFVGWEDNSHYLVAFNTPRGSTIGRCAALTGQCSRATGIVQTRVTVAVGSAFLKDRAR